MGFSEWREVELKDLCEYSRERIPVKNIKLSNYISTENMLKNKEGIEMASKLPSKGSVIKYEKGDILLSNIRPYFKKIWRSTNNGGASNDVLVIKKNKNNDCNNDYLYYYLCKDDFFEYVMAGAKGTKMPRGDKNHIMRYMIKLPPLEEQEAIANILSTLDEKIEVNNQINKTLEEMAQAIFKHWFVDFEFPNENGEPYKSSGGEMVESELGMIPKKWEIVEIGELCKAQIGGDWGKDERFINSVPAVCLRGTDLQKLKELGFSREAPIRWVKKNSIEKRRISELDILIGGSGLGPVGRSLCYSNNFERLYDYPITYSNFCKRIRAIDRPMAIYLEQIIEGLHKTNEIKHYVNGTSVPNLDIKGLLKHKIIKPDNEVIEAFSVIKENYFNYKYSKENLILSQIRNTLLPKLMSGEIRVPIKSGSEIS